MANSRNVNIIIDLVLNHTSNQHPWFKSAKQAIIDNDMDNKYIGYYTLVKANQKESGKNIILSQVITIMKGTFQVQCRN
jgi:maltose alpha-D-glucosyltransferase/alpha-amylase